MVCGFIPSFIHSFIRSFFIVRPGVRVGDGVGAFRIYRAGPVLREEGEDGGASCIYMCVCMCVVMMLVHFHLFYCCSPPFSYRHTHTHT